MLRREHARPRSAAVIRWTRAADRRRGGGGTRSSDATALQPTRQAAESGHRAQGRRTCSADDASTRSWQQLQLLSDGQITDADAQGGRRARSSASPTPPRSTTSSTIAVEQSRLHIPILFAYDTIHGTARSSRSRWARPAASTRRWRPPTTPSRRARRRRSASSRSTARWSMSRTSRAGGESPRPPARIRTSARSSPRARQGRPGQRLLRAGQGRDERQALRRLRPARRRSRVQHDRHVGVAAAQPLPAAVQGGDRRRRRHGDVLVQRHQRRPGLRRSGSSRRTSSRASGGFDGFVESDYTAVAELRACPPVNPDSGPCGHGVAADGPGAAGGSPQRRHRF